MDVIITEISTGKQIAKYPIILGGQNYNPTEQEYFDAAWDSAVEDNLVLDQHREKYSFSFAR